MPAAALLYRQGHVSQAHKTYSLKLDAQAFLTREISPANSATIRTLAEQSRLTVAMPEIRELPWLKPSAPAADAIVLTDLDRDFLPPGQSFVKSDTGEITRDWEQGIQVIDSPKSQVVSGWIGGKKIKTTDASFETRTRKAVVALTSVDNRPLAESQFILVTAVARAVPGANKQPPFASEPVWSRITLRCRTPDMELLALGRDGRVVNRPKFDRSGDELTFTVPAGGGSHWYVLKSRAKTAKPAGGDAEGPARSKAPR